MIEFKKVTFQYGCEPEAEGHEPKGIFDLDLNIEEGECLVLTGGSGCGKTTITRLLNGLIPSFFEGRLDGDTVIGTLNLKSQSIHELSKKVGSVFQNPRSQFFNVDTTSELAFAPENQGLPEELIKKRMEEAVRLFQIEPLMNRSIFQLSDGEKQKIACASVAVAGVEIIVLDEPSSNLDVYAIEELRKILKKWKEMGKTMIIAEHRLYYLRELADRMLILKEGRVIESFDNRRILCLTPADTERMGLRGLNMIEIKCRPEREHEKQGEWKIEALEYQYPHTHMGIQIETLTLEKNSVNAIIGHNGSGKSTLARCICGLEKKCRGSLWDDHRMYKNKDRLKQCYLVMQDVNHQLFTESVLDEVLLNLEEDSTVPEEEIQQKAEEILSSMDLLEYKDTHPMALSGGQKQRVAIASAIASKREIIIFDEPTSGLDYYHMQQVADCILKLQTMGKTVFVITHDLELIMSCCTDIIHMEHGGLKAAYRLNEEHEDKLKEFFCIKLEE